MMARWWPVEQQQIFNIITDPLTYRGTLRNTCGVNYLEMQLTSHQDWFSSQCPASSWLCQNILDQAAEVVFCSEQRLPGDASPCLHWRMILTDCCFCHSQSLAAHFSSLSSQPNNVHTFNIVSTGQPLIPYHDQMCHSPEVSLHCLQGQCCHES